MCGCGCNGAPDGCGGTMTLPDPVQLALDPEYKRRVERELRQRHTDIQRLWKSSPTGFTEGMQGLLDLSAVPLPPCMSQGCWKVHFSHTDEGAPERSLNLSGLDRRFIQDRPRWRNTISDSHDGCLYCDVTGDMSWYDLQVRGAGISAVPRTFVTLKIQFEDDTTIVEKYILEVWTAVLSTAEWTWGSPVARWEITSGSATSLSLGASEYNGVLGLPNFAQIEADDCKNNLCAAKCGTSPSPAGFRFFSGPTHPAVEFYPDTLLGDCSPIRDTNLDPSLPTWADIDNDVWTGFAEDWSSYESSDKEVMIHVAHRENFKRQISLYRANCTPRNFNEIPCQESLSLRTLQHPKDCYEWDFRQNVHYGYQTALLLFNKHSFQESIVDDPPPPPTPPPLP